MKILKIFFKFSFIYFLIYPNKFALTEIEEKELLQSNGINNSSYEIKELKWEKLYDFNSQINNQKWEIIDDFNFQNEQEKLNYSDIFKNIENK